MAQIIVAGKRVKELIQKKIISAKDSQATSVGDYTFYNCKVLTTADFPLATSVGDYAFYSCSKLTTVNSPLITRIGHHAFCNCKVLATADFPLVTSIGANAFYMCSKLTTMDYPLITSIGNYAFYNCTNLTALILRNTDNVCTLSNTNAFTSTPIKSGTGYIYVPSALVADYQKATNWLTYSAQFRALEDYTVDGTITGALDPEKISTTTTEEVSE